MSVIKEMIWNNKLTQHILLPGLPGWDVDFTVSYKHRAANLWQMTITNNNNSVSLLSLHDDGTIGKLFFRRVSDHDQAIAAEIMSQIDGKTLKVICSMFAKVAG